MSENQEVQTEAKVTTVSFGGKEVNFGVRAKSIKEVSDNGVTFYLKNGNIVEVLLDEIPAATVRRLALHGVAQKVGDEGAGVDDIDDIQENFEEMKRRLYNGDWGAERKAGEGKGASLLAKALVAVTGQTLEQVRAILAKFSAADKAKLRQNPKVREEIQRLEAERAAQADPSTGEALLGLFN